MQDVHTHSSFVLIRWMLSPAWISCPQRGHFEVTRAFIERRTGPDPVPALEVHRPPGVPLTVASIRRRLSSSSLRALSITDFEISSLREPPLEVPCDLAPFFFRRFRRGLT
jgi:hypothetical protein